MTWFEQSPNASEAAKEHVHMFFAVAIDLPSGLLCVWSGYGDLPSFDSNTYRGIGELGSISPATEHARLLSEKKSFRLSGADPSLVDESDIDGGFGRSITQYFGFLDSSGNLVATPEVLWEGRIDSFNRLDSAEPYIEITAENRMVLLDRPNGWRYVHEHQQQFFAGDDGLKLVPTTVTSEVIWGDRRIIVGGQVLTGLDATLYPIRGY